MRFFAENFWADWSFLQRADAGIIGRGFPLLRRRKHQGRTLLAVGVACLAVTNEEKVLCDRSKNVGRQTGQSQPTVTNSALRPRLLILRDMVCGLRWVFLDGWMVDASGEAPVV
ncbi:uncharacterized protein MYCFIDRAFT_171030 [Pseudocercospora fijiensis CIRAD86]|uniref:Uncharacterized protein n=1 Tax=Pseudocercospora fijiensis (strain CIRAD86) TaxID=383855 RepID=N1QCP9_PSEFD|nr:uncharacterized protein MYCFIDRAFT_171030 [Pseudocercospora fijiensis CIRAD86]EME89602.1 hypothetical protein MYCFIDRAFT_171030 [Pseudocercospora fijiensis CIRAD86]